MNILNFILAFSLKTKTVPYNIDPVKRGDKLYDDNLIWSISQQQIKTTLDILKDSKRNLAGQCFWHIENTVSMCS